MTVPQAPRTAAETQESVLHGVRDPRELVEDAFAHAERVRLGAGGLNAVLWSDERAAMREAARLEARRDELPPASLLGVPVAIKDNIATLGLPTTCGSRMLEGFISPYDATVVTRLRRAGAIVVAKTNMDEFGMGSSCEFSAWGAVRNPIDPTRVPGGSSGGSAVAVAAGLAPIALGSETGGSIRQPASFCGVVGVKPTYGRVSRYGLVAFASSLDQVGVFGRTIDDAALALGAIAGHDPRDSTSSDVPVPQYRDASMRSLHGVVIGKPREYFPDTLDAGVRAHCERALAALAERGATVKEVSLEQTALAVPAYHVIAPAEASSNLARFDGVRYGLRLTGDGLARMYESTRATGFGPEVTRRILLGTYLLSAGRHETYYRQAQRVRGLIVRDFANVFAGGVDLLFTPTTPGPAFPLGSRTEDPYAMYMSDVFTAAANLAGIPAMSQPIGRVDGLPVGGQLLAPHFREFEMFTAAYALERALGAEAAR